jgi:glycosyltransferase involved in cell wall biosynthesis
VESIQLLGRRWPKEFPLVVDFHNVHSREAARSGRGDEEGRALALERRALEACSIAVASSTDESAALTSLNAERPVVTVAQGYDPDEWPPGTRAFDGRTVCFFGSLDFGPNIDGLRWFLTQCWPHVLRRMPAAQLMLYGKGAPPSDIREHPGVRVIGWVERLSEAIAGSSCVIVPNVGGPGTRVKLPEAMASGLPVVVTRHGAEGIDAPNALSIADDPAIFGGLVATYLVDAEAARLAGQRARAYAERWCGWSERAGELERALHAAVAMVVQ